MPIHTRTWLGRLTVQVPGWYFWYLPYPSADKPWHAVPELSGQRVDRPYDRPGRVDASSPQELRSRCEARRRHEVPSRRAAE